MAGKAPTPYVIRIRLRADDRLMEEIPFETADALCDYLRKRYVEQNRYIQLENMDLSGRNLDSVKLYNARLTGVNMAGASMKFAQMMDARLDDVDLSGAELKDAVGVGAKISNSRFCGAEMSGANFARVDMHNTDLTAITCDDHLTLDKARITDCNFTDATCQNTALWAARIQNSDFSRAVLNYSQMTEAVIGDTHFDDAQMVRVSLRQAQVTRSKFLGADLTDIGVERASFVESRLKSAKHLSMQGVPKAMTGFSPAQMQRLRRRAMTGLAGAAP